MAQNPSTSRSSFSTSSDNEITPVNNNSALVVSNDNEITEITSENTFASFSNSDGDDINSGFNIAPSMPSSALSLSTQVAGANPWFSRFHVNGFSNLMPKSIQSAGKRFLPKRHVKASSTGRRLTITVYFLDGRFQKLEYDMSTTVADAVEKFARLIKLSDYASFGLFVTSSKSLDPGNEEYIELDNNKYIRDLLVEFKLAAKDRSKEEILHSKLIFKKKLFPHSDEDKTDKMFVKLCYIQLQHDYMLGYYSVERDVAAQLSALQILAKIGPVSTLQSHSNWSLDQVLPRKISMTRAACDWELDIESQLHSLGHLSKNNAMQQFLGIFKALPDGNSVFFNVRMIDDPIGLLPERVTLGINKKAIHFYRPVVMECLQSAELKDILHCERKINAIISLKILIAGVFHIFQFETKQEKEIYKASQTLLGDAMLHCISKAGSSSGEYQRNIINKLQKELVEKQKQQEKMQEELDRLRLQLKVSILEKKNRQARIAKLNNLAILACIFFLYILILPNCT